MSDHERSFLIMEHAGNAISEFVNNIFILLIWGIQWLINLNVIDMNFLDFLRSLDVYQKDHHFTSMYMLSQSNLLEIPNFQRNCEENMSDSIE